MRESNQAPIVGWTASCAIRRIALLVSLLLLPAAGWAQSPRPCENGSWSEPVPVFPDSGSIASPSLVFHNGQGIVVGNRFWSNDLTQIGFRLARLDGTPLPAPVTNDSLFIFPVATSGPLGLLHLFWAEPKPKVEQQPRWGDYFGRVFHAAFFGEDSDRVLNGRRILWSVPEPIYNAERIIWRGNRDAKVVAAPDGTLHLAFPSLRRGIVHLRMRQSTDRAELLRQVTEFYGDGGLYVDLALGPNGEVYLPYIAPYPTAPGPQGFDTNSVLFRRSPDGGATWERPVLVSQSGDAEAHYVRVAATPSGDLHLVWLKNLSGGHITEVVWHSLSRDGGRSWSAPHQIAAPAGNPRGLRVAVDGSGALHVVFVSWNDSPHNKLYHVRWDHGRWSTPCVVDPDLPLAGTEPAIATDGKGHVHLIWERGSRAGGAEDAKAVAVRAVLRSSSD